MQKHSRYLHSSSRLNRLGRLLLAGMLPLALLPSATFAATVASPRERISFNADWRFAKDDPAESAGKLNYETLKPWLVAGGTEFSLNTPSAAKPAGNPGGDVVYTQPGFDDSAWRKLNLPHDWGIEGPFKQEYPGETGKLPWWGVAWYRKHFTVSAGDQGQQFYLDVDGAMAYASVWLNGQFVGGWPYGYSSWRLDLTPYLKPGADNVIAIRLDNPETSSRWYPGGGIYRNVWLVKTAPVHVGHWGTFVTTPEINKDSATVSLKVDIDNRSASEAQVKVLTEIYELNAAGQKTGRPVTAMTPANLKLSAGSTGTATLTANLSHPKLWDVKKPNRYVAVTSVEQTGKTVDRYETPFGVRTIKFTVDNGFLLNGARVPLQGVCDHHDLGALGSAISTRGLERQIQLLQEMGCNAIRTSHNPPSATGWVWS
jgi:beta-galactosidase